VEIARKKLSGTGLEDTVEETSHVQETARKYSDDIIRKQATDVQNTRSKHKEKRTQTTQKTSKFLQTFI